MTSLLTTSNIRRLTSEKYNTMKKLLSAVILVFAVLETLAQNITVKIDNDSTFDAANFEVVASEEFDNIAPVHTVNIAFQTLCDIVFTSTSLDDDRFSAPDNYLRERADLLFSSKLEDNTNIYALMAFLNTQDGVNSDSKLVVPNVEIEHYFKKGNCKVRVGRLLNSLTKSQYFGRIAVEQSSAHVYGRKVYINDALEFDGRIGNGSVAAYYCLGIKPRFKKLDLRGVYGGASKNFASGLRMHCLLSFNRQFEDELKNEITGYEGSNTYFAGEIEFSIKKAMFEAYANCGGYTHYVGRVPHSSNAYDYLKFLSPVVSDTHNSLKETFIHAYGMRFFPKSNFFSQVGLESEFLGSFSNNFSAYNFCAYMKLSLTRRLLLTYYCTPQVIKQQTVDKTTGDYSACGNFLRLSVLVGKPVRMMQ